MFCAENVLYYAGAVSRGEPPRVRCGGAEHTVEELLERGRVRTPSEPPRGPRFFDR